MEKLYCVQYKLEPFDWEANWFETKEERELYIDELKATDKFKIKKYISYLNDFGDIVKIERNK